VGSSVGGRYWGYYDIRALQQANAWPEENEAGGLKATEFDVFG
jgi:hypothetical protein